MAADETQSLEYKSIPSTYQSVVFVENANNIYSLYTGDGWVLPLSCNSKQNTIELDGDIVVMDTLSCFKAGKCGTLYDTVSGNIHTFNGNSINKNTANPNIYVNNVDFNNPFSIIADETVYNKYNEISIPFKSMYVSKYTINNITTTSSAITINTSDVMTVMYVIPCIITYNGVQNDNTISIQANCNGVYSSIAKSSLECYFEKWGDNAEPLKHDDDGGNVTEYKCYCSLIGSFTSNVGSNKITVQVNNLPTSNCTWKIDEDNILILAR